MTRAILLFGAVAAFAQTAATPAFEVASIKPHHDNGVPYHYFQFLTGGRLHVVNTWIKFAVEQAYNLKNYQVSGGPAWITSDRFDIEARADASTNEAQMRVMLQSLLADRVQLKVHQDTKEFPVYDLVVDKNGVKSRPLKQGDSSQCSRENSEICGIRTMAQLADWLTSVTGHPVFDKTEMKDEYDLLVNFDTYELRGQPAPADYNKPPLTTALKEQAGLRLEPRKAQIPVLVIDSVQRPSEN